MKIEQSGFLSIFEKWQVTMGLFSNFDQNLKLSKVDFSSIVEKLEKFANFGKKLKNEPSGFSSSLEKIAKLTVANFQILAEN